MLRLKKRRAHQHNRLVRLVHVVSGLGLGGNESLCLQLIKHAPSNTENFLISLDPSRAEMLPHFQQVMPAQNIIVCSYHAQHRFRFILDLWRQLQIIQPDVVLVQPFGLHIFVAIAARLAGVKRILTRAGNPAPQAPSERQTWKRIIQLSHWLQVPVHACSEATHQSLQALAPLPKGSFPIPNGCDVAAIAATAAHARQQRAAHSPLVIGMVARLNSIKDQATLIRAFALLRPVHPALQLWLVGDGEDRPHLTALAQQLGVDAEVTFWGARSDIPALLGQMDIYAFSTTEAEGFGIALIEAMAAQLPIVASDVAACREVLAQGAAGELVPPGQPQALATALARLVEAPVAHRQALGQRAYQRASDCYSMAACAQRWYGALLPPLKQPLTFL